MCRWKIGRTDTGASAKRVESGNYLPEWLNACWQCVAEDMGDTESVDDEEGDGETH